jgi:hypothetical protein
MRQKMWVYSPPKPKVPDAVKVGVETKAMALVNDILKPEHVKPPPKNAKWNYIVDIYTKWHRNYFYFCAKYACPGPNALSPFFDTGFARLEYAGGVGQQSRFHLSYMRHTGRCGRFDMACYLSNVWPKSEGMGSSTPEFALVFQYKKGSIKFQKTRDVKSWI